MDEKIRVATEVAHGSKLYAKIAVFAPEYEEKNSILVAKSGNNINSYVEYSEQSVSDFINEINEMKLDYLEIPYKLAPYTLDLVKEVVKQINGPRLITINTKLYYAQFFDYTSSLHFIESLYRALQRRENELEVLLKFEVDSSDFCNASNICNTCITNAIRAFEKNFKNVPNFCPEFIFDKRKDIEKVVNSPYTSLALDENDSLKLNGRIDVKDGRSIPISILWNSSPSYIDSPAILQNLQAFVTITRSLAPIYKKDSNIERAAKIFFSVKSFN